LREALDALGEQLGMPRTDTVAIVSRVLNDVVGAHARLRSLRAGTCVVEVDGPAWATRVRYASEAFRTAANQACGATIVEAVHVAVTASRKAR
jgi:predicted nucleic acid-binding Zn ribbon protein